MFNLMNYQLSLVVIIVAWLMRNILWQNDTSAGVVIIIPPLGNLLQYLNQHPLVQLGLLAIHQLIHFCYLLHVKK